MYFLSHITNHVLYCKLHIVSPRSDTSDFRSSMKKDMETWVAEIKLVHVALIIKMFILLYKGCKGNVNMRELGVIYATLYNDPEAIYRFA